MLESTEFGHAVWNAGGDVVRSLGYGAGTGAGTLEGRLCKDGGGLLTMALMILVT